LTAAKLKPLTFSVLGFAFSNFTNIRIFMIFYASCPSVGQSVKFLLAFASTVIPAFSLLEIHDQDFCSLLDMYVFRNAAFSSTREGVGLAL
jgi:hypothetical protein